MAVYPHQLTSEEKQLKKRYARLQEKRKLLRKAQEKPSTSSTFTSKPTQKEAVNPKDAKEVAKRLLETGKLTIKTKLTPRRSGFKRVGEMPGEAPPTKKPHTQHVHIPPKPKIKASDVKELYSRTFVKASNPDDHLERIPKRREEPEALQKSEDQFKTEECTVCVECAGLSEEALHIAFTRFGDIRELMQDSSKSKFFATFATPKVATKVIEEMNEGMIRGRDVYVEPARKENGYFDLPPEAANDPWALLAAGKELPDAPVRRSEGKRQRNTISYETDF